MKYRIYLDNCCFNRPYDDQAHLLVQLETEQNCLFSKPYWTERLNWFGLIF